jgi:hypothetical protein
MAGTPDRVAARLGAAAELNLQNCALVVHSVRCAACFPPHAELPRKLVETAFLDRGPDARSQLPKVARVVKVTPMTYRGFFLLDPDGNNIEACYRGADAPTLPSS